ncbi:hypothetical protein RZS08_54545, partial [Arthrospira platensis SPKY1]|nr:hypothetical protein [Arthrospira platensis SPKY1]
MVQTVNAWQAAIHKAVAMAVQAGHLRVDTEPQQLAFEIHGLILALHYDARFLRNPGAVTRAQQGFEHLMAL